MVVFVDETPATPEEICVRRDEEVNQIRVECWKNPEAPVRMTIDETWALVDKLVRVVGEIRAEEKIRGGGEDGGH